MCTIGAERSTTKLKDTSGGESDNPSGQWTNWGAKARPLADLGFLASFAFILAPIVVA